jgi:hypothetical protein
LQCVTFSTRQGSNIGKQSTVMGCIRLWKCWCRIRMWSQQSGGYNEKQGGGFAWNILDHCYYLGFYVRPRII